MHAPSLTKTMSAVNAKWVYWLTSCLAILSLTVWVCDIIFLLKSKDSHSSLPYQEIPLQKIWSISRFQTVGLCFFRTGSSDRTKHGLMKQKGGSAYCSYSSQLSWLDLIVLGWNRRSFPIQPKPEDQPESEYKELNGLWATDMTTRQWKSAQKWASDPRSSDACGLVAHLTCPCPLTLPTGHLSWTTKKSKFQLCRLLFWLFWPSLAYSAFRSLALAR